mgnify:CR=1 FL=1
MLANEVSKVNNNYYTNLLINDPLAFLLQKGHFKQQPNVFEGLESLLLWKRQLKFTTFMIPANMKMRKNTGGIKHQKNGFMRLSF